MQLFVCVDGSESAERALAWATDLATRLHATVVLAHVVPDPVYVVAPETAAMLGPMPHEIRERLAAVAEHDWAAPLRRAGVDYDIVLLDGPIAHTLLDEAERRGADLVVLGRRGLSGVKSLILGSVSNQVTHHSTLPVVVIP